MALNDKFGKHVLGTYPHIYFMDTPAKVHEII